MRSRDRESIKAGDNLESPFYSRLDFDADGRGTFSRGTMLKCENVWTYDYCTVLIVTVLADRYSWCISA